MDSRSLSFLWIILIFIHGCLGLDMRINLDWGYIYFNLTKGADAVNFKCAKDFSLLDINSHKQEDIATAFEDINRYLNVLVKDPESEVCYSEAVGEVYQPKSTNCATKDFEIKEKGMISQVTGSSTDKLQWVLVKIKTNKPANQTTGNSCLVYDIKTQQIASMRCSGKKIPGVACQKNPEPASDPITNMRQIVIIGSSIGLSSLVLQICILIGCAICWCRNRECCGGGRREARPKPSDAARCVRLQSLTSDGDSSAAYDHVHRDPLSRSLHSLNHLQHQQKLEQDGHLYNELGGGVAVDTSSPYSQPYTHFVPTQPRNPPPKGPPPVLPSGNEYAEPYPAAGRAAQEWRSTRT